MILDLWRNALATVALVAAPFLVVALAVGLVTSFLQAATQLSENVLSFVPKIVAMGLVLALAGPWVVRKLTENTAASFGTITRIAEEVRK
ncbi:MAG TPA: flagellar biosynthetic protein FliQ [Haliangiales bacterium]|nr:flagellar biosynthetic protein FliQ [Haliangiales bacterium]